ncbi:sensor protein ZraS [bacterium BMS3Abin07]|nr:sensor protein ZraS [bacterium BMS3Abin07]GBE31221.1 sensor protein ZraS [bacterium BMS3Bbin05]HDO23268.1 hypothetical protein [Nitrospirota bacterium]HDZ88493.1 hypothetical protein [Nitrospirota bacterium]
MKILSELNRRTSIKTKSLLYVVLLIIIIYISVSIIVLSSAQNDLSIQQKQFHDKVAKDLAINAADTLVSENYGALMEKIRQLKQGGQIKNAEIIDVRGIIIASDKLNNLGKMDKDMLMKFTDSIETKYEVDDSTLLLPVEINGDILGAIRVTFDLKSENATIRKNLERTILRLISLFVIIFGAAVGGSYVVSLLITRPITILLRDIRHFGEDVLRGRSYIFNPQDRDETYQLRKAFQDLLENLKAYLEEIERVSDEKEKLTCMAAIGEMSAQIAHELRNSLYAIRGAITGIEHTREMSGVREYTEIMKDEIIDMTVMADDFLRFSKVPAPELLLYNVDDVIQKVLELLEPDLDDSGVKTVKNGELNLPVIMIDPTLMKQVFMNLFINSIQAMEGGGLIFYEYQVHDNWLDIHIQDTGPGIAEEVASRVFQPFFTTKMDGSGLGLATAYKIMLAHHGEIKILKQDKGAHFLLRFPLPEPESSGK